MFNFFVLWVSNVINIWRYLMIKKLVFGMLLVMCVMGCSKKESSAALTLPHQNGQLGHGLIQVV
jgi:hypothetical protein